MIKLSIREMKVLSRILTICLCSVPLFGAFADGPIATTSGSNLTAFHPSTSYNNQWNNLSNGRTDTSTSGNAKADFGNCNALISRCAQPKCGNGGCADAGVAEAIVKGCVLSNTSCKKYGDDLITVMTAQLVAASTTKINNQEMQIAQMQSAQNQQQMAEMQSQMMQMQQNMQQQMAQQNAQTAAAVQDALAQQQALHEKEMAEMKTAATDAAMQKESGLTAYEEKAIANGATSDLLERKKIAGEILTKIENAEVSMKAVESTMRDAFKYAQCDNRGNNCIGPKRVKKFREIVTDFSEPYDNVVEQIYDALDDARFVGGIDLSDIMMMLDNSCQNWAQYLCQPGYIQYTTDKDGNKVAPMSCDKEPESGFNDCNRIAGVTVQQTTNANGSVTTSRSGGDDSAYQSCKEQFHCRRCSKVKQLTSKDEIFTGWVETEFDDTDEAQKVVACADSAVTNNKMLGRRAKARNGAGLIDPDVMADLLSVVEPNNLLNTEECSGKKLANCYKDALKKICYTDDKARTNLQRAIASKSIPSCLAYLNSSGNKPEDCICTSGVYTEDGGCEAINPLYALCDTHVYNIGEINNEIGDVLRGDMKEVIALKTTVIAQQLYKQYEYLKATLHRLQIMLEKAVYASKLEVAGAKSESGSSGSSSDSSSGKNKDKTVKLNGAVNCSSYREFNDFSNCISNNVSLIVTHAEDNDKGNACKQLLSDLRAVNARVKVEVSAMGNTAGMQWSSCTKYFQNDDTTKEVRTICDGEGNKNRENIRACAYELNAALSYAQRQVNSGNGVLERLLQR